MPAYGDSLSPFLSLKTKHLCKMPSWSVGIGFALLGLWPGNAKGALVLPHSAQWAPAPYWGTYWVPMHHAGDSGTL